MIGDVNVELLQAIINDWMYYGRDKTLAEWLHSRNVRVGPQYAEMVWAKPKWWESFA